MGTWNERMTPRPKREPKLELVKTLWTLTKSVREHPLAPDRSITAAIYVTDVGRELRVHYSADVNNLLGFGALTRRGLAARI
jgi:hypothetical protein